MKKYSSLRKLSKKNRVPNQGDQSIVREKSGSFFEIWKEPRIDIHIAELYRYTLWAEICVNHVV